MATAIITTRMAKRATGKPATPTKPSPKLANGREREILLGRCDALVCEVEEGLTEGERLGASG